MVVVVVAGVVVAVAVPMAVVLEEGSTGSDVNKSGFDVMSGYMRRCCRNSKPLHIINTAVPNLEIHVFFFFLVGGWLRAVESRSLPSGRGCLLIVSSVVRCSVRDSVCGLLYPDRKVFVSSLSKCLERESSASFCWLAELRNARGARSYDYNNTWVFFWHVVLEQRGHQSLTCTAVVF